MEARGEMLFPKFFGFSPSSSFMVDDPYESLAGLYKNALKFLTMRT